MKKAIKLRPHHLLCTQTFEGRGYSPSFVDNMEKIVAQLRADKTTEVEIVSGVDDLCEKCPHLLADGTCESQAKIEKLDAKAAEFFCVSEDVYTYADLIKSHPISQQIILQICGDCSWVDICACPPEHLAHIVG